MNLIDAFGLSGPFCKYEVTAPENGKVKSPNDAKMVPRKKNFERRKMIDHLNECRKRMMNVCLCVLSKQSFSIAPEPIPNIAYRSERMMMMMQ